MMIARVLNSSSLVLHQLTINAHIKYANLCHGFESRSIQDVKPMLRLIHVPNPGSLKTIEKKEKYKLPKTLVLNN